MQLSHLFTTFAVVMVTSISLTGAATATTGCSGALAADGMTQCLAYHVGSGNPAGGTDTEDLFDDLSAWYELGTQLEAGSGTVISFGDFEATFVPDGAYGSAKTGTWAVNFWPDVSIDIAFVLKAGPGYVAYMMDQVVGSLSGDWNTVQLGDKGISNISVWAKPGLGVAPTPFETPTPAIPLPAAAWLLLGGIGGLAGLRRLKR